MTRARDVANVLSTATSLATDTETAAAISSHNTAANGHTTRGNTAGRPASPTVGDVYINTENGVLEIYESTGWTSVVPPSVPSSVVATNQGSGRAYNSGQASIAFSTGTFAGTTYTITSSPGSYTASGSSSPITITGLQSSTQYTYTAVASSKFGTSLASSASTGVTATTVPQAPTINSVTGGDAQVSVAFTAGATGGSAITGFTVTSSPGSLTASGASSPLVVTGLTNGTAYTFTAVATNANGTSSASTASSSVTPIVSGDYVSIATTTVGSGGAANVEFTSIPASFTHLQVRGIARSNGTLDGFTARFNSDTNSNYTRHRVYGNGANVPADGNAPRTNITLADGALPGTGSNIFAPVVFDIVDYANSNKYKTLRSLGGTDNNGSGTIWLNSGSWMSTSAITSIKIEPGDGSWVQYTEFALYGIKGA